MTVPESVALIQYFLQMQQGYVTSMNKMKKYFAREGYNMRYCDEIVLSMGRQYRRAYEALSCAVQRKLPGQGVDDQLIDKTLREDPNLWRKEG